MRNLRNHMDSLRAHLKHPVDLEKIFSTEVVFGMVLTALLAALLVAVLGSNVDATKTTFQFLLLGVIGGFVSLAFRAHEQRQKTNAENLSREQIKRESIKEYLSNFYSDILVIYNKTKKARRVLEAKSELLGTRRVSFDVYESIMLELEEIQLKLEQHKREVELQRFVFGDAIDCIRSNLERMEKYLRRVCKGYERRKWTRAVDANLNLVELDPVTHAFISKSEVPRASVPELDEEFIKPASAVRDEIRRLLDAL